MSLVRHAKFKAFVLVAAAFALHSVATESSAADALSRARQLMAQARAYPELNKINEQIAGLITRMDASTAQLGQYRKNKVKARDPRYSALTREFNQERTRIGELERKLQRPVLLDPTRFPPPADSPKGSPGRDAYQSVLADEKKRLEVAQGQLQEALKALIAHYDQQLRVIASLRN